MFIKSIQTFWVSLQYVLHTAFWPVYSSHVQWGAIMMISEMKKNNGLYYTDWSFDFIDYVVEFKRLRHWIW